ncbi:terminase family protein [Rhodococcus sp. Z13]|uniref:Terminase family protein n=1 Tax=Rhodococcus sacchari TaxID=2962047 RepID=A0ACD4DCN0_9NOCA|nr:terminase family protein [Rhodococcus sp. Z13]UYP17733.1 terminase family protein [Rhodococcus sp. Z13]
MDYTAEALREHTRTWTPERKAAMLAWLQAQHARRVIQTHYTHPAQLAAACDPNYVITPATETISKAVEHAIREPRQNLLVTMPPQEGKLVSHDTPVPTPDGWTTHGEIRPGDTVFHPSGVPIKVLEVHQPAAADRRVHFSDHSYIDVHHRHEWTVWDRACGGYRIVETARLESVKLSSGPPGTRGHRYRFQLPWQEPLRCEPADLPLDPYTLGVWLGDGTTTKPAITHHPDDHYELPYAVTKSFIHATTGIVTDYYGEELRRDLIAAGVFKNKHIPQKYLRGSIEQRRALLAGLIDTDGHVSKNGQVSFDNSNETLVRGAAELARSLGYRAHVHKPTEPKLSTSGIQGKKRMWRLTFSPHDVAPARLPRKAAAFRPAIRRRIAITKIEAIDPTPGHCITVDSEDGLYLVGDHMTPTHNSSLCAVWAPLRALQINPDTRIIVTAYGDALAEDHSRTARGWIETAGTGAVDAITGQPVEDKIGLQLDRTSTAVSNWKITSGKGGYKAVGLGSSITGRAADLLIVDDPYKNMQEADSAAHRRKVSEWFKAVALTRLSPDASVIVIQTRWHENDLAGEIIATEAELPPEERTWRHINIPAISEAGIPDELGRPPGVAMISARGRTQDQFEARRRQVGERVWYALYQGVPTPNEGGLFSRSWFDDHRLEHQPDRSTMRVVAVDPAETGEGDEAGVIAAALQPDGSIALTHDRSGHMTSDQWGHAAVALAMETHATEIAVETYTAGTTYVNVIRRAITAYRRKLEETFDGRDRDTAAAIRRTHDLKVHPWRGKGDAIARSALLRQAIETGTCRVVWPELVEFVDQAVSWQQGQHQPDRVAAAIIAHDRLQLRSSKTASFGNPVRPTVTRQAPAWMTRKLG